MRGSLAAVPRFAHKAAAASSGKCATAHAQLTVCSTAFCPPGGSSEHQKKIALLRMCGSPGRAGRKPELQLGTAHACARTSGAVIPEGSPGIRLCSHTLALISSHHKSPIVVRMVCSCGRCVIPKVLRRRCSDCRQEWAKRKAVWLGESGVDVRLLSLLHQNFDGWVGLLNRWNDWKKLQKIRAPLRQAAGPEGTPVSVHVPFTASDLLNCKQAVGSYRNNPEGIGSGVGSRHKCEGLERVKEYQKLVLYGIQHGVQKPKNLSKLSEVRQGHKETPSAFSERLCEVARKGTDRDPEDDSNSKLFNMLFIGQAAADIRER
ncbi:hypothetical protein QYF61_018058 [Mycteria americana]|uniref:Core shell protein Gag P30 domain-containing protein n=1 Tax=Mycteria americana TaxID=33587 RepID=A0AAN7N7G7_MYCAM|nr:hypothetical protein QYF61_018058 [Mycteria americana]